MKNNVTEKKHNELRPFTNTLTQRVSNITQTLDKLSTSGILDKKQTEKGTFYSASIPFLKFYIPFGVEIAERDEGSNNVYGQNIHPSITNFGRFIIDGNDKKAMNVFHGLHALSAYNDGKGEKLGFVFHDINRKDIHLDQYKEYEFLTGLGLHITVTTPEQALENLEKILIHIEKTGSFASKNKKEIKDTLEATE